MSSAITGNSRLRQRFANAGLNTDQHSTSNISLPSHGGDKLSANYSKTSIEGLNHTYPNIVPINFGVKFAPPKLGLSYFIVGQTETQSLLYEIMLKDFLMMDAETITSKLFEIHEDYLNPKYIKRMQVKRLVEKVLSVCGSNGKENSDKRNAKPVQTTTQPQKKVDGYVQLDRQPAPQAIKNQKVTLLEQAPDSERSLPSMPSIGSHNNFNDDLASANSSLGAKAALDNLEINLEEINQLNKMGEGDIKKQKHKDDLDQIEKMFSSGAMPKNLSGTLKEVRNAVEKEDLAKKHKKYLDEEDNLSFVEKSSNASALMYGEDPVSPDEHHKSLVSANMGDQNKSYADGAESNMEMMLNDFNNQSQSQAEGEQSFVNKEGTSGLDIDDDEIDPNQIDLENLNESELMALQQQAQDNEDMLDGGDAVGEAEGDEDFIDVDNPEDLERKGLRRIQIEGDDEQEYLLDAEGNIYNLQGEFVGETDGGNFEVDQDQ